MEIPDVLKQEIEKIKNSILWKLYCDNAITEKEHNFYADQNFVKIIKTEELVDHLRKLIKDKPMLFYRLTTKE